MKSIVFRSLLFIVFVCSVFGLQFPKKYSVRIGRSKSNAGLYPISATLNHAPFLVHILDMGKSQLLNNASNLNYERSRIICTGVLLSNQLVLTSAQCLLNKFTKLQMKTERLAAAIPSMNRTFKVEDAQTHADFNSIGLLKPHDLAVLKLEDASQQIDQSSRLCVSTKAADNRDLIVLKSQFDFQTSPFIQVQPNWISTSFFRIPLIDRNSALFCSSRPDQYCGQAFAPVFEDKDVGAPLLVRTNGQWSIASVLSVFDQKKVIATRLVDKNLIWLQWLLRDQLCIL